VIDYVCMPYDSRSKLNKDLKPNIRKEHGSGHEVRPSKDNLDNDIEVWEESGVITNVNEDKDTGAYVVEFDPTHKLADALDRHFFNLYSTPAGKSSNGTIVMPQ
jgi:hypothetical protein